MTPSQPSGGDSDAAQLQRRNYELTILNLITEALNREVDLSRALQSVLGQVADLLGLRTGWIWLFNEESGDSYLAAAQNLPPALANNPRRMEGTCYCLDTFRQGDLAGAANVNVVTCSSPQEPDRRHGWPALPRQRPAGCPRPPARRAERRQP